MVCVADSPVTSSSELSAIRKKIQKRKVLVVEKEFTALKSLVPSVSDRSSASPLEVVLEAISYIRNLESKLGDADPEVIRANFLSAYGRVQ